MVHKIASSSKKFNNSIDFQQRKSKKHNRKTRTTEKPSNRLNKQNDLKKIAKARKQKQDRNMTYSRVHIRNGKQMYDTFDDIYDYNRQFEYCDITYEYKYDVFFNLDNISNKPYGFINSTFEEFYEFDIYNNSLHRKKIIFVTTNFNVPKRELQKQM